MKTKSLKLDSLPADLRSVADELLAKKFPEPEIIEKKQPSYAGRTVQFPPHIDMTAAFSGDDFATVTQSVSQPTQSTIDKESLDCLLNQYRGMGNNYQLTLLFSITPVGSFPNHGYDNHYLMHQLHNERIELQIMGDQIHKIGIYLRERLKALEILYEGYFYCRLDRVDVRMTDSMYGDVPF